VNLDRAVVMEDQGMHVPTVGLENVEVVIQPARQLNGDERNHDQYLDIGGGD
jgi:hypothetical protein